MARLVHAPSCMTTQGHRRARTPALVEVGPDVFAYIQAGGEMGVANAGLIVGRSGAVAVDSLMVPSMTWSFIAAIRRVTSSPVRYLVNTHHHLDHTGGNHLFVGARIVAAAECRDILAEGFPPAATLGRFMPRFAREFSALRPVLPTLLLNDAPALGDGDREIRLWHPGWIAHTPGDTTVTVPSAGVLFAGDLAFHGVTPLALQGHVGNWLESLDHLLALDLRVIVPGHGPVGTKVDLARMRDYLAFVHREARIRYGAGMTAEQAAYDIPLGDYGSWREPERIVPNVARCFQEFRHETCLALDRVRIFEAMERLRASREPHARVE